VLWYNYGTIHGTLRTTPAMALGLTRHVWTLEEVIAEALAVADEPAPPPVAPPPPIVALPEKPWQKPEQLVLFGATPPPAPPVASAPPASPPLSKTSQITAPRLRLILGGLS
jgi:hypothetical protein